MNIKFKNIIGTQNFILKFCEMLCFIVALILVCSCGKKEPQTYIQISQQPPIFPDYKDITIPCNIAPMNFKVEGATAISLKIEGRKTYEIESNSDLLEFSEKGWRKILENETNNTINLYIKATIDGKHYGYQGFKWTIAAEKIDKYLSYRLIEPAYEVWNMLQIAERNVENFNERLLGDNGITDNSCMNCHTSNRAQTPTTFMHVRGAKGATIYSNGNVVRKINTKTEQTAGAVYGEIDSAGRYGIFTTAQIIPILHSYRSERLEVYDTESDLILIDFEKNTVTNRPCISGEAWQETFPCFSADNRTIYFARAPHFTQPDSTKQVRYNLYAIDFNPENGTLGDSIRLVFDAASRGKSVSFPKCSRNGKYLLMTVSDYGTFPIWHNETDLWMLNLATGAVDSLPQTNGRYSDSYHSWSSNSHWICFASKRGDRVYGRPYFAYVADDGTVGKAFVLPQKNPDKYISTLKSFNIPELYNTPENYDALKIRDIYFDMETEKFTYKN